MNKQRLTRLTVVLTRSAVALAGDDDERDGKEQVIDVRLTDGIK